MWWSIPIDSESRICLLEEFPCKESFQVNIWGCFWCSNWRWKICVGIGVEKESMEMGWWKDFGVWNDGIMSEKEFDGDGTSRMERFVNLDWWPDRKIPWRDVKLSGRSSKMERVWCWLKSLFPDDGTGWRAMKYCWPEDRYLPEPNRCAVTLQWCPMCRWWCRDACEVLRKSCRCWLESKPGIRSAEAVGPVSETLLSFEFEILGICTWSLSGSSESVCLTPQRLEDSHVRADRPTPTPGFKNKCLEVVSKSQPGWVIWSSCSWKSRYRVWKGFSHGITLETTIRARSWVPEIPRVFVLWPFSGRSCWGRRYFILEDRTELAETRRVFPFSDLLTGAEG